MVQTGWRSTRIETTKLEHITLTNNSIAREAVKNYTRSGLVGIDVYFGASYSAAPNEVRREALAAIAKKAIARKTGARGLRSILEGSLMDVMYDLPSLKNVQKVVIDESSIADGGKIGRAHV